MADILVTLTFPDGTTISVRTDANGRYEFVGLPRGSYKIKPENQDPYIFYSNIIDLSNDSLNGIDFTAINLDSVEDPGVAELLRRSSEVSSAGAPEGGYSSLNDWINNLMNGKS